MRTPTQRTRLKLAVALAAAPGAGRLRELRAWGDPGGARGSGGRDPGHPQLRGRGPAVHRDRALSRGPGQAAAVRRGRRRPAGGQGALRARDRHPRAGRRHDAAPDPGQVPGARHPRTAAEADRDRQPELPEPEPGRDQRHQADRRAAQARPLVLRADLVADHPARQGPAGLRQGAGLRPAPRVAEPGDADLRQRRRTRPVGLCRAEARADPGRGHPVDLLGGLAQLERAAGADRGALLRRGPAGRRQPGDGRRLRDHQPQPGQPRGHRRHAAADQPAGQRRPETPAHRRRLPQPRHPGVHAVQPAAAARGRAGGPAGHRRGRRLLRPAARPSPGGSSPRPSSSPSPTPTT